MNDSLWWGTYIKDLLSKAFEVLNCEVPLLGMTFFELFVGLAVIGLATFIIKHLLGLEVSSFDSAYQNLHASERKSQLVSARRFFHDERG